MKRRDALAALGAAGTVGFGGYFIARSLADEELQRRVTLSSQDSLADEYEVSIDVELVESRITNLQTAQLKITTTNEGPERDISIGTDGCALFDRMHGGSDEPSGLWLHRPDEARNIDRKDDRWERALSAPPREFLSYGCTLRTYGAGESLSNHYLVWDDYDVEGYLVPGTYRWEEDVSISNGEDTDDTSWGFSLTVESPD